MISEFPPPWNFQIDLDCPQGSGDINVPTPMELQTFHKDKIYKNPNPMELQIDLDCPRG